MIKLSVTTIPTASIVLSGNRNIFCQPQRNETEKIIFELEYDDEITFLIKRKKKKRLHIRHLFRGSNWLIANLVLGKAVEQKQFDSRMKSPEVFPNFGLTAFH